MRMHKRLSRTLLTALLLGGCMAAVAQAPATQAPAARRAASPRTGAATSPDRIAGRVVSSVDGHGIPNAVVTLQESAAMAAGNPLRGDNNRKVVASTRSDAEGRYRFAAQAPGKYNLHATAAGYLGASYQQHEGFSTAVVVGAGLPVDALQLVLVPSAVISGRVLDEAGDPVQHAQITLYREAQGANSEEPANEPDDAPPSARVQRLRSVTSNDDGTFEFAGLAPGRFFVSASGMPWYATHPHVEAENASFAYRSSVDPALDVAYPELFYPNSTDSAGATPIVLKGGERLSTNFTMQPERALTLTVRLPAGEGAGRSVYPQLTRTVFGISEPVQSQFGGQYGNSMVISGLAPGRYSLQAFSPGNRLPQNSGPIDLTGSSTSIDLQAPDPSENATVHAVLHGLGTATLPSEIQLNLRSVRQATLRAGILSERLKDTKEATLTNIPPGEYRFSAYSDGRLLNVAGLSLNGRRAADDLLRIPGKGDFAADLTLTSYSPAVEGFVQRDGKPVPAAMVVLVPAGADGSLQLFRRDQSDLDGSFHLNNVVPGDYLLVAIDDGWKLPRWNDAAALTTYLTHATPVTIPVSGGNPIRVAEPLVPQPR